jgi:NAD(P)-dependent dehydrogenase (short-subunit alcohol dehydrogenase family)
MAAQAFREAGPVTGLVNCAGVYPNTAFLDLRPDEWDRVLAVNLRGPFLVTQAVARRMIAAGVQGSVVNISSTASRLARPGIAHYGASKAGLNQLTAVMAVELAPHGIRVNAILPGVIGTERVLAATASPAAHAEHAAKLARIPLGRLGEPVDVVNLALFLLSPVSAYCTGGLYPVDGGFTLGIPSYR